MEISNSKKKLAKIISENGGWRDGAKFAAQGGNYGHVGFASVAPVRKGKVWDMTLGFAGKFPADEILPNWHQTILSREEYFHLYPAQDAVMVMAKAEELEHVWTNPPTIEQLAADYRAKLAIAQQAQEEADSHRCGAEAALEKLYQAGLLIGLDIAIANDESEAQEDEPLNITDWRDLQVGDEVEITSVFSRGRNEGYEHLIGKTATVRFVGDPSTQSLEVSHNSVARYIDGFKFIRRP